MSGVTATQAWITGIETVELREARLEPDAGSVLIRTAYAGICGSDLHTYRHGHAWFDFRSGRGTRRSARSRPSVPTSTAWRWATASCCSRRSSAASAGCAAAAGRTCASGSSATALTSPAAWRTPSSFLPPRPAGCRRTVARAGGVEGATVAVLGGGTIGLCLTVALRDAGAARVVVSDRHERKREVARQVGADESVAGDAPDAVGAIREALGAVPDVVFDCAATAVTVEQSMALADRGGRIVIVGCRGPVAPVDWNRVQDLEQSLVGTQMYTDADFDAAIPLVDRRRALMQELVTAVYPVERAPEAFAAAAAGGEIKVQLRGGG